MGIVLDYQYKGMRNVVDSDNYYFLFSFFYVLGLELIFLQVFFYLVIVIVFKMGIIFINILQKRKLSLIEGYILFRIIYLLNGRVGVE